MLRGRTPLGWLQLSHSRMRFAVAISGVGFAVMLVFMQLGFMNMLFDATTTIHRQFQTDLVVMSAEAKGLVPDSGSFSRRRLIQAAGDPAVADWAEVYIGSVSWTKPSDGTVGSITLFGVPTDVRVFVDPAIDAQIPSLRVPNTFLFDEGSRGDFAAFIAAIGAGQQPATKLGGKTATAVGTFKFGASFGTEAIAIVSTETFMRLSASADPGVISMGLLRLEPGQDAQAAAKRIEARLAPSEVRVHTMTDFIGITTSFIKRESPIAMVFSFGVAIGLIVGAITVIQILSSDVQDHLAEYATFKAMGFTNRYLLGIVYEQSTILSVLGFIPALLVSLGLYRLVGSTVSMDMTMTWSRIVFVFALTVAMCAVAGTIALKRVYTADPAEVF